MAAQKYGPPLVGCALHTSGSACYKCNALMGAQSGRTSHGQADQHREEGYLT